MFLEAGIEADVIEAESSVQPLKSPQDFWTIVLGSGYRGTVEQLDSKQRERVRAATVKYLVEHDVRDVETNAIFALARKPT